MDGRAWRVLIALGIIALALVGWVWWQGRAQPVAVVADHVASSAAAATGTDLDSDMDVVSGMDVVSSMGEVIVHVAGAVRRPGLVHLPAGSRVADALTAVGGATSPRAEGSVNLARLLVDGEQIQVLASGLIGGAQAGGKVLLNSASAKQLEELPGVGPVLASRIVEFRTEHGGFRSIDQLNEVSGIGDALLSRLRSHVQV